MFSAQVQDSKSAASSAGFSLNVTSPTAPTISGISPTSGSTVGGTTVTVSGTNFRAGAGVQFGALLATSVQVVSSTQLQAVTPPESTGSVDVTVQDSDGQSAKAPSAFSFVGPLQIAAASLPAGAVGVSYSSILSALGGTPPYSWSTVGGTLPPGLQLNASSGAIAGTPITAGSFSFTAKVLDAKAASSTAGFSLSVAPAGSPTISTTSLPSGSMGVAYSSGLVASGGTPPYSWSTAGGTLPPGLQLNASSGAIAGTPSTAGSFSFTARVLDAKAASSTSGFSLSITSASGPTITSVVPNSGSTLGGTTVTVSGTNFRSGVGVQFGSHLATSVNLVSQTQLQAVTPAEPSGIVDVYVQDTAGQVADAPNAFTFIAPLRIATTTLPTGTVGSAYSSSLSASGGVPPYSWSTIGGTQPAGLQLNASSGTITGTPSTAGSSSFTAKVQDANLVTATTALSIAISANPAPTISGVSPNSGPAAGGTAITISGTNFRTGAVVQFGGLAASSVQIVNATQIQAVTPAESSGTIDVTVQDSDGLTATSVDAFTFTNPGSNTPPVVPTASSDPLAPQIFNASSGAQAGEIGFIQGSNFDSTSQVWLGGATAATATKLTVVNTSGTTWMAVQLPQSWSGAMVLWVSNSHGASKSVALNGAVPTHLDTLQLVPKGAFRVLGRNLVVSGLTPVVTVDGQAATINLGGSDENMLVATAPASLSPTSASVIKVDNGNGTGPVALDREVSVVAGSGDPYGLGVGWGAGFTFASQITKVSTPCDGKQDDTANIQAAINSASSLGATVQLPGGTCRVTSSLMMKSNVVLQGAGKDVTVLKYEGNYPISSKGADLVGLADLTILNSGSIVEGPIWQNNTRSFFLRIKIDMGVSHQLFFTGNTNFVVSQCDFIQRGSVGGQNPYLFNSSGGLVFTGNTTTSIDGSPTFKFSHDSLFIANHFTRDASNQNESPVIATHRFVMDFCHHIAIIGNTFDVTHGPVTNKLRNDGETLLTEGGGSNRTENLGVVISATANSISDPTNTLNVNPFGTGLPENYGVAIVDGKGAGQTREVVAYSNGTMQVDHAWDVIPDSTSHYATFVWGLEKSLLKGNTLTDNPRGIWLYQTAIRDVDILANTITNGGGIYLRTFQSRAAKQFDPIYDVRIRNNKVSNSTGLWMSYINVVFVNKDQTSFGIGDIGIEINNNTQTANVPNVISQTEEYAGREGYMDLMRSETSGGQLTSTPTVLGTIFKGNQCINCSTPFIIGTGDYGTVLFGNTPPPSSANSITDWQTLGTSIGGSIGTVAQ